GRSREADDWMPKWPGAFLPVFLGAGVWVLLLVLRRIDPRRVHYESFRDTFWLLLTVLIAFFALIQVVSLGTALGWPIAASRVILLADRKSTRLNSSHVKISYAVFCLKKKIKAGGLASGGDAFV